MHSLHCSLIGRESVVVVIEINKYIPLMVQLVAFHCRSTLAQAQLLYSVGKCHHFRSTVACHGMLTKLDYTKLIMHAIHCERILSF